MTVDDWYAVAKPGPGGAPSTAGWVKAKSVVPIPAQGPGATPTSLIQSGVEAVFRIAVDGAVGLRDQYKNNPYVTIKGFSIDVAPHQPRPARDAADALEC